MIIFRVPLYGIIYDGHDIKTHQPKDHGLKRVKRANGHVEHVFGHISSFGLEQFMWNTQHDKFIALFKPLLYVLRFLLSLASLVQFNIPSVGKDDGRISVFEGLETFRSEYEYNYKILKHARVYSRKLVVERIGF